MNLDNSNPKDDRLPQPLVRVTPFQFGLFTLIIFAIGFALGNQLTVIQAQDDTIPDDAEAQFVPIYQVFNQIESQYIEDVDPSLLIDAAIDGMVNALGDQYSGYLPPEDYQRFDISLSGDMEGIGATITTNEDGNIEVVNVLRNAPAEAAGVQPGDVFISVDGTDVRGMNQLDLVTLVRGPAGSEVTIVFDRGGDLVEISIIRERFEVPSVDYRVLEEQDIAYIYLADFNQRSRQQLDQALAELDVNSRRGLILDLRGNPGGLLSSVVDVTSAFQEDGVILYEEFGDGRRETLEATGDTSGVRVPIVVLVDERSASASELFAGALQANELATIVGETTFGKGTVQTIAPLANGGGLRLTIARWLTPDNRSIADVGITPDIRVTLPDDYDFERDGDIQLDAAIDAMLDLTDEVPADAA